MIYLTLEDVYTVHIQMIAVGGGRGDIHDFGLFHSAVERPKATFSGHDLYATLWLKAAALLHSLVTNHPFDDGNKRTAYYSTKRFLQSNGWVLFSDTKETVKFMVSVDVKNLTLDDIVTWLKKHSQKM